MARKLLNSDPRPPERIRAHYEIEKELAGTLRAAPREERRRLYTAVYNEMFRRVPDHPMLVAKEDPAAKERTIRSWLAFLRPLLHREAIYLEVGPGDCSMAFAVCREVKQVYGVDVSHELTRRARVPENFRLFISDGCSIPVPEGSVDVAFSHQLMEHLHPEDAIVQLRNIVRALKPGGAYVCSTPNRLSGPHDVSQYFDDAACGFHLREYTSGELEGVFRQSGFSRFRYFALLKGRSFTLPSPLIRALEWTLSRLPLSWRGRLARIFPLPWVLGVNVVAWKSRD